nr:family 78 glycoside hydrolase catalytic domain [Bacteroides sp. 51]
MSFLLVGTAQSGSVFVEGLQTEQLTNPLGIDAMSPRLSWRIVSNERGVVQTSYQILVASSPEKLAQNEADVWDSGTVFSNASQWINYQGPKFISNKRYYWKVKVNTNIGEAPWSDTALWGMGLLGESRWKGRWIGLEKASLWDTESQWSRLSARYLRKEFSLGKEIKQATVHISGLGLYELFINGQRVGDLVLAPAPTDYRKTLLYNSYDVTSLLRSQNDNAVGVTLGNGRMYTMRQHYKQYKINNYGYPKLRMNLIVEYTDGTQETIVSDTDWKLTADGPIRSNNEYDGEDYDARKELTGWSEVGYNDSLWQNADRAALPQGTLRAQMMPGMRVVETIKPVTINKLNNNKYILDMGQNMVGWIRMKVKGQTGDSVKLRFAEILQENGELYVDNLRDALVTDTYILKGKDLEEWAPRFVYHGFRYVEVTGYPGTPTPDYFIGEVVNDDMQTTGEFKSDNLVLNQILQNAFWGIRGNYKGMPVDCPQRNERQPWLGDRAMGALGESFLMANGPLYAKWMDDIREAQREDGCIPDVAPAFWNYYSENMTWPSALVLISDMLYEQYGNIRPIQKNYQAMRLWMKHMKDEFMTPEYVVTRDRYGDWCLPPESPELIHSKDPARITDGKLISTAYYYQMLKYLSKFAGLLQLSDDIKEYDELAIKVKDGFNRAFGNAEKQCYDNNTVTANLLPLAFDIVPQEHIARVEKNIIEGMVFYSEVKVSSGVIGIQWIMRELARMGRSDVAYVLATHTRYPGWGYMVANGATTIWELWNGNTANPEMNSGNHVMLLGDLLPFCYENLAGIKSAAPGFSKLEMKPAFEVEEIRNIQASYITPYGKVMSHWTQTAVDYQWDITIPANTTATIWLPNESANDITEGKRKLNQAKGVSVLRSENGYSICEIGSGNYSFFIPKDITFGKDRQGILVDEFIFDEAPFPESHASTIAETPEGLVAAWFGGTKEKNPDCCIWVSRNVKGKWTVPVVVADGIIGNQEKRACWNPVLSVAPNGELLLFYKVGLDVPRWSGHLVRSKDNGKTWSRSEALPEGFLGPVKNKPVYIDNRMICPSSTEGELGWRVHFEVSDDNGKTWRMVGPIEASEVIETDKVKRSGDISTVQAIQPSILMHKDGRLQALCRTRNNGAVATTWSSDKGETWTPLKLTTLPNNNSGTDAVNLKDGRFVFVYNHYRYLPGGGMNKNRTPINIALSDDGVHWDASVVLEDSPINQYSYPSVIQSKDGMIHVVYTWRRQRIKYVKLDPRKMERKTFVEAGWKDY